MLISMLRLLFVSFLMFLGGTVQAEERMRLAMLTDPSLSFNRYPASVLRLSESDKYVLIAELLSGKL